jgi:hypothetical protein
MIVDQAVRGLLLVGAALVFGAAIRVLAHTRRASRRGSIMAMFPTLLCWSVFEVGALLRWELDVLQWISRLGVISLLTTFLYQLWLTDYAESVEKRMTSE